MLARLIEESTLGDTATAACLALAVEGTSPFLAEARHLAASPASRKRILDTLALAERVEAALAADEITVAQAWKIWCLL